MTTKVTIPEPFVWNKTFEVGYDNLDEQHKMMFMCIMDMCNNPCDKMRLECMMAVMCCNFKTEEVMMKCCNYPDYTNHKMAHDNFMMKLKSMCCPLKDNDLHYCKEWLVDHIMTMDMMYKNKLHTYPM